jgi:putative transposase
LLRQAELLEVSRSALYTTPVPTSAKDLRTLFCLDLEYTDHPEYGILKLIHILERDHGIEIGKDHLRTLRRILGLETIYPKPKTSTPFVGHTVYPYLLRDYKINKPNDVWSTDITYIRLTHGFCYLVAILDWYSRYVVHWELSPTLEIPFCLQNISRALEIGTPHIHNSDQGSHFTSPQYTDILKSKNIAISMDGRGRCMDNIFIERLWRTVKYENVYTHGYSTIEDVHEELTKYFHHYNTSRPHQSLEYKTPQEVHYKKS